MLKASKLPKDTSMGAHFLIRCECCNTVVVITVHWGKVTNHSAPVAMWTHVTTADECCNVSKTVCRRLFSCLTMLLSTLMHCWGLRVTSVSAWRSSWALPDWSATASSLRNVPTWDCMLAPTCPPWYESPLRDCTLMNKSPEFDMLKEPAEPENTERCRRRQKEQEKKVRKAERKELKWTCWSKTALNWLVWEGRAVLAKTLRCYLTVSVAYEDFSLLKMFNTRQR